MLRWRTMSATAIPHFGLPENQHDLFRREPFLFRGRAPLLKEKV